MFDSSVVFAFLAIIYFMAFLYIFAVFFAISVGTGFMYSFKHRGWLKEDGWTATEATVKRVTNLYKHASNFAWLSYLYATFFIWGFWSERISWLINVVIAVAILWLIAKILLSSKFYKVDYLMS